MTQASAFTPEECWKNVIKQTRGTGTPQKLPRIKKGKGFPVNVVYLGTQRNLARMVSEVSGSCCSIEIPRWSFLSLFTDPLQHVSSYLASRSDMRYATTMLEIKRKFRQLKGKTEEGFEIKGPSVSGVDRKAITNMATNVASIPHFRMMRTQATTTCRESDIRVRKTDVSRSLILRSEETCHQQRLRQARC